MRARRAKRWDLLAILAGFALVTLLGVGIFPIGWPGPAMGQGISPGGGVSPSSFVRGTSGNVANTAQTQIIAAQAGSLKNYITSIQCGNTGITTSTVTFNDSASTVLINPAGAGTNVVFPVPLVTAAATAFQMTPGSSSTNQWCNAQGYSGT